MAGGGGIAGSYNNSKFFTKFLLVTKDKNIKINSSKKFQ